MTLDWFTRRANAHPVFAPTIAPPSSHRVLAVMARKLRLEFPGAIYHVINRGNYRRDLFSAKGAASSFQACLFEAATRFGWRLPRM